MSFKLANINDRASLVFGDNYFDIEEISDGYLTSDLMLALKAEDELFSLGASLNDKKPSGSISDICFGPPVPKPSNCYAIGLNYKNHAEESTMSIPDAPMVFAKHSNSINGPNDDIKLRSDYVDYEAELVVVIGKPGKDILVENAWKHVFGLCIGQDISDRPVQFTASPPQFNLGKSFDTYGPIGPVITSPKALKDCNSLEIKCEINGELRQKDNTKDLIFNIPTLIKYISEIVTLDTGDLIFTGTPAGVGAVSGNFLRDGDVITTSIDGLGVIQNKCVRVSSHSRSEIIPEALANLLSKAQANNISKS